MAKSSAIIKDFTKGPLFWDMIKFSLPFMLSNALQVCYSMTDMFVVGRYVGSHGLAAISIASLATMFPTMIALGMTTGGQVYISQLIGAGKKDRLNSAIGTLFSMILLTALLITLLGCVLAKNFLNLLSTPEEAFQEAYNYFFICSAGMLFIFGYNMISAVLRGMGDAKHPFWFIVIASIINVILDIFFIAVLKWGSGGAGLATVLSQAISFIISLIFLYRRRMDFGFDFKLRSWKMDRQIAKVLLQLGIPFTCRFAAINISMLYVNALINSLGVSASAAFGISTRMDDLANKISQGVMMAVSTISGQNYAAGEFQRVRKSVYYAWWMCGAFFLLFGLILYFFPREMYGIFTEDHAVLDLAPILIPLFLCHYPALAIMKGTNGFMQGIGNAKLGFIIAILDGLVFRVGLSWFFGIYLGWALKGFVAGYALATWATAIPTLVYFYFAPWHLRENVTK